VKLSFSEKSNAVFNIEYALLFEHKLIQQQQLNDRISITAIENGVLAKQYYYLQLPQPLNQSNLARNINSCIKKGCLSTRFS